MIYAESDPKVPSFKEAWNFIEFIQARNRLELITHFNKIFGPPNVALSVLQAEFIRGDIEPWEIIAFVKVCRGLIAGAMQTSN